MPESNLQPVIDQIATDMITISGGLTSEWQEGDKRVRLHRLDHMARAIKDLAGVKFKEQDREQSAFVSFVNDGVIDDG